VTSVEPADAKLRNEVVLAARTLEQLLDERDVLGVEVADAITSTVAEVRHRLDREELAVVVVGEKKSGKSTFLNAILGARVLPTDVRECTGTVTFIRSAPAPTYRATLRGGETVAFEDVDWNERANIAISIKELREKLGDRTNAAHRSDDAKAALVRAIKEHDAAQKPRREAEAAHRELTAQATTLDVDIERAEQQCNVAMATGAQLEEQLVVQRDRALKEERSFEQLSAEARSVAERQGLALPGMDAGDVEPTSTALQLADQRLARELATAPFFLRPASAFFVVWLRFLLQWFFLARVRAIAEARDMRELTRLSLLGCAAAQKRDEAKQVEAEVAAELALARAKLGDLHDRKRAIEAARTVAKDQLTMAAVTLAKHERAEQLAKLAVLYARTQLLEEQLYERFRTEVQELTDMAKKGSDVLELTIGFPTKHLPDGITIIDTPGVNTDNEENRARAWEVIRKEADGCILVSDLQQVVSRNTRDFLKEVCALIPHILLVMTKVDSALANAHVVNVEPWQRVDEARKTGVRRFAKEIGRAPEDVFSIAVAAEPALRRNFAGDVLARRFPGEVAKLFNLLQSEKELVLAARAAAGLRYCVQRITEAETRAEDKFRKRISELEQQRLPDPCEFQKRQLAKVTPAVQAHAEAIAKRAREALAAGIDTLKEECVDAIRGLTEKDELRGAAAELGKEAQKRIAVVMRSVEQRISEASVDALRALEAPLLADLRERYRIVQNMTGSAMTFQTTGLQVVAAPTHGTAVTADVRSAVASFEREQIAFGAGGAIAGAALGTVILPGIGTAIGAAVGALATYLKTLESLKNDCIAAVTKALESAREDLTTQLSSVESDVQRTLRDVLVRGLADAVARFETWIKQVMDEERRLLEDERAKLSQLIKRRENLIKHDKNLAAVQRATATHSRGLSV
jgi:hypothetical protein